MEKIQKIDAVQLDTAISNSGLAVAESSEIKKSYIPFVSQLEEVQTAAEKINFDNPAEIDETIARELRLKTVRIRTAAEKLKDERKRQYLIRGNLEQASYNVIALSCKMTEELFYAVEKAREIAERKRKQQLTEERTGLLQPYCEDVSVYNLGEMSKQGFTNLLAMMKKAYFDRREAERKAELARIKEEKAREAEQRRLRAENERLVKEARAREADAEKQRQQRAEILKKRSGLLTGKGFRLVSGYYTLPHVWSCPEEHVASLSDKDFTDYLASIDEAADRYTELKRLEAEKRKQIEEQERQEKLARAEQRRQRLAPDQEKLLILAEQLSEIKIPIVKSDEAHRVLDTAEQRIRSLVQYLTEQAATFK